MATRRISGRNGRSIPRTNFCVNTSRLTFESRTPTKLGRLKTFVSLDLFGNALSTTPSLRMRQAYGELEGVLWGGDLLFGQAWGTYVDLEAWPDILDFEGPGSAIAARQPMVRWSKGIADQRPPSSAGAARRRLRPGRRPSNPPAGPGGHVEMVIRSRLPAGGRDSARPSRRRRRGSGGKCHGLGFCRLRQGCLCRRAATWSSKPATVRAPADTTTISLLSRSTTPPLRASSSYRSSLTKLASDTAGARR